MSQDYHQGMLSFSNGGLERSAMAMARQQESNPHQQQQIRREKLRMQGFDPTPPPLVGVEEEESTGFNVYENAGMLSEMFNYQPEMAEQPSFRPARTANNEWYANRQGMVVGLGPLEELKASRNHHHQISTISADSAAAMQLFLMNPQPRSPSPPPPPSSTLHMLLPNPSSSLQSYGQFTWIPDGGNANPASEIRGIPESQGLSLSLSSSLPHLEAAKAEELRLAGNGGFLFYNQGGASSSSQYSFRNLVNQNQQLTGSDQPIHVTFGTSLGSVNLLRSSKYSKAAQELLEEFCSVGKAQLKRNKSINERNSNPSPNLAGGTNGSGVGGGGGGSSSSSKDQQPPLSSCDRIEHQRRKVKLLSMLDEVDRRYQNYCEQMQIVVNSFDMVMGFGAAALYTALTQKAMSRHFRCLKDAIGAQLKHSCELLGEKDAGGTSGLTKGETPRLKMLEQSLRNQRAFHQMGMMEQEAWRPQRGLPERSVNILRAWLFEHFLHPYPSDADKQLLARQTGLSRNQVSNWFINARVRLWKPMVEDMYQQESKDEEEEEGEEDQDRSEERERNKKSVISQTPTLSQATSTTSPPTTKTTTPPPSTTKTTTKRSHFNPQESDPSLTAINAQTSSEIQANQPISSVTPNDLPPPHLLQTFQDAQFGRKPFVGGGDYGTTSDSGSSVIRFGTKVAGDVSLTLGLRHVGNLPEKNSFSVRDFGGY